MLGCSTWGVRRVESSDMEPWTIDASSASLQTKGSEDTMQPPLLSDDASLHHEQTNNYEAFICGQNKTPALQLCTPTHIDTQFPHTYCRHKHTTYTDTNSTHKHTHSSSQHGQVGPMCFKSGQKMWPQVCLPTLAELCGLVRHAGPWAAHTYTTHAYTCIPCTHILHTQMHKHHKDTHSNKHTRAHQKHTQHTQTHTNGCTHTSTHVGAQIHTQTGKHTPHTNPARAETHTITQRLKEFPVPLHHFQHFFPLESGDTSPGSISCPRPLPSGSIWGPFNPPSKEVCPVNGEKTWPQY